MHICGTQDKTPLRGGGGMPFRARLDKRVALGGSLPVFSFAFLVRRFQTR